VRHFARRECFVDVGGRHREVESILREQHSAARRR
jgi:hypothetical protein